MSGFREVMAAPSVELAGKIAEILREFRLAQTIRNVRPPLSLL
jgi:hypothetical protein